MIIFDTETTGLAKSSMTPLDKQTSIVEFAAIKLDDETFREIGRMEFMCNPNKMIEPDAVRVSGITNEMVSTKPPFSAYLKVLSEFFLGERTMVAHNVAFDRDMLKYELMRLDRIHHFPWPMNHVCTVERTFYIQNRKLKLIELYQHFFNEKFKDAHRAMNDVEALTRIVIELHSRGKL
jgi:DNA polymerase III epsilon subunit-like protein